MTEIDTSETLKRKETEPQTQKDAITSFVSTIVGNEENLRLEAIYIGAQITSQKEKRFKLENGSCF
jgi:hypothetical protein